MMIRLKEFTGNDTALNEEFITGYVCREGKGKIEGIPTYVVDILTVGFAFPVEFITMAAREEFIKKYLDDKRGEDENA
jgi:hypothetical protein